MKKLHERLITTVGIAALLAVFCYQVAYGSHVSSTMGASHPGTLSNIGIPLVSSVSAGLVLGLVRG